FFPLLVLGASLGAVFATIVISLFHLPSHLFANLVILAMAGTFTAIVRAPMTGILLLVEMTGSFDHLLPLALVSLIAYVVADLLQSE
ncbi:chloride channel protein, partial [Streptococcus suis]